MPTARYGLSIAGLDPTGGAGILADIKTFEALGVTGFAVSTCMTFQNEHTFYGVNWTGCRNIINQLEPLFEFHPITHAKIGLIENWETLRGVIAFLRSKNEKIQIVWDPVLSSSSGFRFHESSFTGKHIALLKSVDLFTPNLEELDQLFPAPDGGDAGATLSAHCAVLLKGGHRASERADDVLYENGQAAVIEGPKLPHSKHGTGCVLSAAIVAFLAQGHALKESCRLAKDYINDFLSGNTGLLGVHPLQYEKAHL